MPVAFWQRLRLSCLRIQQRALSPCKAASGAEIRDDSAGEKAGPWRVRLFHGRGLRATSLFRAAHVAVRHAFLHAIILGISGRAGFLTDFLARFFLRKGRPGYGQKAKRHHDPNDLRHPRSPRNEWRESLSWGDEPGHAHAGPGAFFYAAEIWIIPQRRIHKRGYRRQPSAHSTPTP